MYHVIKIIIFVVVGLFFFGLLHAWYQTKCQWHLPPNKILKPVSIVGVIDSVPEQTFQGVKFVFQVSDFESKPLSTSMIIHWYHHPPPLKIGQRWQLWVRLKPPIGLKNPGGFDYAVWLSRQGIVATGNVLKDKSQQLLQRSTGYGLTKLRVRIEKAISQAVSDHTIAAVLAALSVGLRDHFQQADWEVFQHTGTNHLVAIAGLHIGLVASVILMLVQWCWRQLPKCLLFCPAMRAGQMASIVAALAYTALSGFAIPAQRAVIMMVCFTVCDLLSYRLLFYQRFCFAFVLVLFIEPMAIFSASFALSFFAVFMLGYLFCARLGSEKGWISWIRLQVSLCIALVSISVWYFHQTSLVSLLANAVAIPWIMFVVLPTLLFSVMVFLGGAGILATMLFKLSGWLLKPLWWFLELLSNQSWSSWQHIMSSAWIFVAAIIATLIVLSPKGVPAKWLGCIGFFPLFFYHPKPPALGDFWVTVLDVGQGLSVVVQTASHQLIYDTGLHLPQGFDAGSTIVVPFLAWSGIREVNCMVISHGDNDHSGGAAAIIAAMPVYQVLTSAPKFQKKFHGQFCQAGQHWDWDNVHFEMLSPQAHAPYQDNNSSCVLKISNAHHAILLTGDIEKSQEMELVQRLGEKLAATVLVVPHHGSRTSSSPAFLETVSPRAAVISLGAYNRYHFPAQSVIERFKSAGVELYTTAKNGAIEIRFSHEGQVIWHLESRPNQHSS